MAVELAGRRRWSPVASDQNRSGASPGVMGGWSRNSLQNPGSGAALGKTEERTMARGQRSGRQPSVGPRPDAAEPLYLFSLWTITLDHSTLSPMPNDTTTTSCVHQHPSTPTSCPPIYHFLFSTYPSVVPSLRPYTVTSLARCPSPTMPLASRTGPTHLS